jgi:hypothetical protein
MRKGITLEIFAGVFSVCAVALVFTVLVSASSRASHRPLIVSAAGATRPLDVLPSPAPAAAPAPSPAASPPPEASPDALPLTAGTPTATIRPTPVPTPKPTASATPTPTPRIDQPPTIVLVVTPRSGTAPLTVTIDASQSWDTDGTRIANFSFNFGDGTSESPKGGATVVTHTYAAGSYTISVIAIDTAGNTSTSFVTIVAH